MDISYLTAEGKFNYRVCAVMIHHGMILAMKDERADYYYLPGGRVKMGETAEDAVLRELREELDIAPHIQRPLWLNQAFFTEDADHIRYHELCVYFLIEIGDTGLLSRGLTFTRQEGPHAHVFEWLPFERLKDAYFYPAFLKTEIFHLPEVITLRTEIE